MTGMAGRESFSRHERQYTCNDGDAGHRSLGGRSARQGKMTRGFVDKLARGAVALPFRRLRRGPQPRARGSRGVRASARPGRLGSTAIDAMDHHAELARKQAGSSVGGARAVRRMLPRPFQPRSLGVYEQLSPARRRTLIPLFTLMLAGAAAELATIGALMPFLAFLTHTQIRHSWPMSRRCWTFSARMAPARSMC